MGCFSFYPAKNLGACGEGGAVTTSDPALARQIRMLREWGQSGKYVHQLKGGNDRMDGLQGAILRVKLAHLEAWNRARRERASRYDEGLQEANVVIPRVMEHCAHVYHLYSVQCDDRDGLREHLERQGIMTGIHYPTPVHLQPAYDTLGYGTGSFPVSEAVARRVVSLPLYPELPLESVDRVCEAVRGMRPRQGGV